MQAVPSSNGQIWRPCVVVERNIKPVSLAVLISIRGSRTALSRLVATTTMCREAKSRCWPALL